MWCAISRSQPQAQEKKEHLLMIKRAEDREGKHRRGQALRGKKALQRNRRQRKGCEKAKLENVGGEKLNSRLGNLLVSLLLPRTTIACMRGMFATGKQKIHPENAFTYIAVIAGSSGKILSHKKKKKKEYNRKRTENGIIKKIL